MKELKAIKIWTVDEILADYKQRIDKAIEYIETNYYDFTYTYTKNEELKSNQLETIKDILKGCDKDV